MQLEEGEQGLSIRCIAWALEQRVGDQAAKLVLLALADEASDPGIARPGRQRIAWKAELSLSTVKRALAYLEQRQLIRVHNRGRRPDGLHLTNVYQLAIGALPGMQAERFEPPRTLDEVPVVGGGVNLNPPLKGGGDAVGGGVTLTPGRVTAMTRGGVTAMTHSPSCPDALRQEGAAGAARAPLDGLKAALGNACGMDPDRMTRSAKRALGLAAKEISEAGGTADEVARAARRWPEVFAGAAMTPKGISNQWAKLLGAKRQVVPLRDERALAESEARGRAESNLRLLRNPPDLVRGENETWLEFAERTEQAFKASTRRAS